MPWTPYNVFAETIFTATRMTPYDPTGMNPYAGIKAQRCNRSGRHGLLSWLGLSGKGKS